MVVSMALSRVCTPSGARVGAPARAPTTRLWLQELQSARRVPPVTALSTALGGRAALPPPIMVGRCCQRGRGHGGEQHHAVRTRSALGPSEAANAGGGIEEEEGLEEVERVPLPRAKEWRKSAQVKSIPIDSLFWMPPKRRGKAFDKETREMVKELKSRGMRRPVDVWEGEGGGRWYLTSGRSLRLQAVANFTHITSVKCRVLGAPPENGFSPARYEAFKETARRWRSEDAEVAKRDKLFKKKDGGGLTQRASKRVLAKAGGGAAGAGGDFKSALKAVQAQAAKKAAKQGKSD